MTGRVDSVIVSLTSGRKLREMPRPMMSFHPREQVHIFARLNKTLGSDMTILSTKSGGSFGMCLLIQYDSAKLSTICSG